MRRRRLRPLLELLGEELWLRPAVGMAVGFTLGLGLTQVEVAPQTPLTFSGDAQAARDVLVSVATATLTVTATVFGFVLVALQVAASQFSPRSLRSFVRDPTTQTSLAILLSLVAYAIAVLMRLDDDRGAPVLAVTVAFGLIAVAVCTLAFVIHHTAQSMRIEHLMRAITRDTLARIPRVHGQELAQADPPAPPPGASQVPAAASGYVQEIDAEVLAEVAAAHDLVLAVHPRVGDHCVAGLPLVAVWRPDGSPPGAAVLEAVERRVADAVAIGFERTMVQDVAFGPRQLVDIALRAISPAINDPRTAVEAVQHLSEILCALTRCPLPPSVCLGQADGSCVVLRRPRFQDYLGIACDQIRRFGAAEPDVGVALLGLLGEVLTSEVGDGRPGGRERAERLAVLRHHVDLVEADARRCVGQPADLSGLLEAAGRLRARIAEQQGESRGATGVGWSHTP